MIWSPKYQKVTNPNDIQAYYDNQHYCVASCQFYVFSSKNKIFTLRNSPFSVENQEKVLNDETLNEIFSSFKFIE
jgi:hypothetical protein